VQCGERGETEGDNNNIIYVVVAAAAMAAGKSELARKGLRG